MSEEKIQVTEEDARDLVLVHRRRIYELKRQIQTFNREVGNLESKIAMMEAKHPELKNPHAAE